MSGLPAGGTSGPGEPMQGHLQPEVSVWQFNIEKLKGMKGVIFKTQRHENAYKLCS